jgi:hypothetical protein
MLLPFSNKKKQQPQHLMGIYEVDKFKNLNREGNQSEFCNPN